MPGLRVHGGQWGTLGKNDVSAKICWHEDSKSSLVERHEGADLACPEMEPKTAAVA